MTNAPPDPSGQRERARRSLRRANTAVAFVLLVVVGLAAVATLASLRARQNQRRAEQAQSTARAELWRAYLSDVRAIRKDKTLGRRPAALEVLGRATAIAPSLSLRNEAVATLALPDFRVEAQFAANPEVQCYAFDRELQRCALGLSTGDIVIRSIGDARELVRLRLADAAIPAEQLGPSSLEFSADGARLAARYRRGALVVWDWAARRSVLQHDTDQARRPASRGRFTEDGRHLIGPVFGPRDGTGVFELSSGQQIAFFPEIDSYRHLAIRPGTPMFAANDGTNVVVVNWETREHVAAFPFEAGVRTLAWSADGRQLAIGGNLLEVHVWDFELRQKRVFSGHKGDVWNVLFDPRGERLATSSFDGTSRLWDLRDGRLIGVAHEGWVREWAIDDRLVLESPGHAVEIRRFVPSPVLRELVGPANVSSGRAMDISADGRWAVSAAGRDRLQAWALDGADGPEMLPVEWLRSLSFHPRENRLLIAKRGGPEWRECSVTTNRSGPRLALGPPLPLKTLANRRLDMIVPSADGRSLAYVELGAGRVWAGPAETNQPTSIREALHNSVADWAGSARGSGTVALSPDGRWLACGVSAPGVLLFDVQTGQAVRQLAPREAGVQFSPDGRWLVAAGREACRVFRVGDWIQVWETAHGRVEQPAAAFSPDGASLAVAHSTRAVLLLDAATGRELVELESPDPAPTVSIRWSADGARLVFATRENHLEVWQPIALRRELRARGLDWSGEGREPAALEPHDPPPESVSAETWLNAGIFGAAALVGVIAFLALRRHRRLTEDFSRTEARAAQREHELEVEREVHQLKSRFVSMVSHEFRTPLGIINSSAQILERYFDRLPAEDRVEQLRSIHRSVKRMSGLMEEVLVLSKAEAGQIAFQPAPLDLTALSRKITEEMELATRQRCPIALQIEPLPPASADEGLLRHILTNLLSNAVKYSSAGQPVEFGVAAHDGNAIFTIRDQGMGIPQSDQAALFTAFHRGRNAGAVPGTGLGLTIVKRCVDLHGGRISWQSAEGRGTTFVVAIPAFPKS
jgi:signal transduction histidine kinase